jgi:hypothetical protein
VRIISISPKLFASIIYSKVRFPILIAAAFRAGLFLLLIILAVDDKYILPGEL